MTAVATFDQNDILQVEPAAAAHLSRFLKEDARGIRISIRDSGCSGYAYVMEAVSEEPADSIVITADGLTLFVDRKCAPALTGCTLRLVKEGLNETVKFDNPNAGSYCGCGESFTINPGIEVQL